MKSSSPAFFRQPIWFSHRGHPAADGVENTREAFDRAKKMGVKGLETDLRISSDGHIVLCHDRNLSRLGGPGTDIWTMSRKELEGIRLGGQSKLLFFDEFVEAYESSQWILDIKPETADRVIPKLQDWLSHQPESRVYDKIAFLFWRKEHEEMMRLHIPRGNYFAREEECKRAGLAVLSGLSFLANITPEKCYAIPPKFLGMNLYRKKYIDFFHRQGAHVIAYLPTTAEEVRAAKEAGCHLGLVDDLRLIN